MLFSGEAEPWENMVTEFVAEIRKLPPSKQRKALDLANSYFPKT